MCRLKGSCQELQGAISALENVDTDARRRTIHPPVADEEANKVVVWRDDIVVIDALTQHSLVARW